ncbi:hypothetical protein FB446DRAFT_754446 [Lentinula raphanica]|nr:hypothetical protein FB446DRAFT_754446 [Lentinula raphanica]
MSMILSDKVVPSSPCFQALPCTLTLCTEDIAQGPGQYKRFRDNVHCSLFSHRITINCRWARAQGVKRDLYKPGRVSSPALRNFLALNLFHPMPGLMKRVRFSSINALYSPVPSTPYVFTTSTSTSTSSSHSKSSHSEDAKHHSKRRRHVSKLTTHSRTKLLDMPAPITRIHYLLAFAPYQIPPIPYDLSTHPSILRSFISSEILSEPATEPAVSLLHITCPHLHWEFTITPTTKPQRSHKTTSHVTVFDVLYTLFRALRLAVHKVEYEALPSPEAIASVNEAYYARCNSIVEVNARQEELVKGIKRVDFLMGRNRFLGLSKKPSRRNDTVVWELNVSS